ncbi:hypothetical protein Bca4012_010331 [Brassica carinata]
MPTTLDQPACWSELPSKPAERRSVVPVLSLKQEEEKLQAPILASPTKQIEKSHETEPEPTTLCLKLGEEAQIAESECGHVPDQRKQEEKVPGGSSNALELVLSIHENQVIMSIGQGVLREIIDILLGSHKELVRPPDQLARFLLVFRDLMLSFYPGEHRTHDETSMVEACLWSKWREALAAAAGYELNGKESFVCYILRHVRSLEMIEQGSKSLLKHGKGLQSWVFDPGDDHVSIILQVPDLRTNPFEGREDGVTLISSILKNMKSRKEGARKWIMERPDELYGKLKGLIHEVLDREKAMDLDVVFIKHGLTLDNHGRPVTTLIDKEMDRMKLVRQEMEWEIQSDREMDWSNRHMRELSWKWKIENQSRKWKIMRTFIIQMSIRSSLVGPGTRWIVPKKELFEKGLYRPKKWKDKPAWFRIGPI